MTISFKKVGALLSSFLLILSCQPTIINTVPKETPKNQVLNNKTFTKKSLDCYIDYIPRSGATIVSNSGGLVVADPHITLANGKLAYDALYVSYGPDAVPLNVEFNVGRLKDGETTAVSGIGRQVYAFGSIGDFSFGGKLWEIPLSGAVTLKDGKLNLKFSGSVANCTTGRAELGICGQNGSAQEPLGGSIEAEIPYNGCLSLDVSRDLVSFYADNDSEFNNVDLNVNASNFVSSRLIANNYTFIKEGKGNYSENLNKDNTHGIPDGNNLIMVHGGYYQSDTKPLKVDSTPPGIEDIKVRNEDGFVKIDVKITDPEINGFSSGIDSEESRIESSLGGTSKCIGDTITYSFPENGKFNDFSDGSSNGLIKVYLYDKVKNKKIIDLDTFSANNNIEEQNNSNFSTKGLIQDYNNKSTSTVYLDPQCNTNYTLIGIYQNLKVKKDKGIGSIYLDVRIKNIETKEIVWEKIIEDNNYLNYLSGNDPTPNLNKYDWNLSGNTLKVKFPWDGTSNIGSMNGQKLKSGKYNFYTAWGWYGSGANIGILTSFGDTLFNAYKDGTGRGPYSFLSDRFLDPKVEPGKEFLPSQKIRIYEENQKIHRNTLKLYQQIHNLSDEQIKNYVVSDDGLEEVLLKPLSSADATPRIGPESQIDHIVPMNNIRKRTGERIGCLEKGTNAYSNARVISAKKNQEKKDKPPL